MIGAIYSNRNPELPVALPGKYGEEILAVL
jgi:hypothetical protein